MYLSLGKQLISVIVESCSATAFVSIMVFVPDSRIKRMTTEQDQ